MLLWSPKTDVLIRIGENIKSEAVFETDHSTKSGILLDIIEVWDKSEGEKRDLCRAFMHEIVWRFDQRPSASNPAFKYKLAEHRIVLESVIHDAFDCNMEVETFTLEYC